MTSHGRARKMKEAADFMLSKPDFDLEHNSTLYTVLRFYDKDKFITAAKALGAGKKQYTGEDIEFIPAGQPEGSELSIMAKRTAVCRLIKPAEYDCDPFLAPSEEEGLGT